MRDAKLLLLQCSFRDGTMFWMLPGGGREEHEDELACVEREVLEETGLVVRVIRLLSDVPAEPPDGTYTRWRTYECTVVGGEAAPGGGEGANAELTALQWLPLSDAAWPPDIANDPYLLPQLLRLRAALAD
jgi:8-oxo-dGTP pyrophosphatase MutT (NUDIX family)